MISAGQFERSRAADLEPFAAGSHGDGKERFPVVLGPVIQALRHWWPGFPDLVR